MAIDIALDGVVLLVEDNGGLPGRLTPVGIHDSLPISTVSLSAAWIDSPHSNAVRVVELKKTPSRSKFRHTCSGQRTPAIYSVHHCSTNSCVQAPGTASQTSRQAEMGEPTLD